MLQSFLDRLLEFAQPGLLALIGGLAKYLRANLREGRQFSWGLFTVNVSLAFLVGLMVGAFVEETNRFRDGIMMLSGYCAYPILDFMEQQLLAAAKKFKP